MFPIELSCLHPEGFAPCDLYKKADDGDFIFFAKKDLRINKIVKENLTEKTNNLYINDEDIDCYFNYVNSALAHIVKNPNVRLENKAEAVYSSCKIIMKRVFDDPRSEFINHAYDLITPTVDLIISNDNAAKHLVKLTAHDQCTYVHSTNVGIFGIALARIFFGDASSHDLQRLGMGFFLHDLGKCKIPLDILNKPGALSPGERNIIKRHPEEGRNLLRESGYATEEAEIIVLQHHERDDGTGYPYGLKGHEIHPYARVCRLADVYEALTSDRPYHRKRTTFEALKVLKEEMSDLDQDLINCFIKLFA